MNENKKHIDIYIVLIGVFTIAGFVMRLLCCIWGRPYELHPDEPAVVPYAVDMIKRHSWIVYSYSRPDQFEIKCDAAIFQIASLLKYRMSADAAFGDHTFFFYFLARLFTAFTGTLLIPVMGLISWRIFRKDKINSKAVAVIASGFTAFSYIFVQHSAYATPDIPLTLFLAVMIYFSLRYLENGRLRDILAVAVLDGIAVTIKYPAAIFTVYIALLIIFRAVKYRRLKEILIRGSVCALILLITIFIVAPNLFTDFDSVVSAFVTESNPSHLGADGLGFWGNLKYYVSTGWDSFGTLSMLFFASGLIFLAVSRKEEHIVLSASLIYWILLSILPLHWIRWGFPMYIAYVMIMSAGTVWLYSLSKDHIRQKVISLSARSVILLLGCISVLSLMAGSAAVTYWSTRTDARAYAAGIADKMSINLGNCFCDTYTPLTMNGGGGEVDTLFTISGDKLEVTEKFAGREYFMTNESYRNRYYSDKDKYSDIIKIYDMVPENYKQLFKVEGGYVDYFRNEFHNIRSCMEYLSGGSKYTGGSIACYALNTEFVSISPYSDKSLYLMISDSNGKSTPGIYKDIYYWTEYTNNKSGTVTIMSRDNDMVLTELDDGETYTAAVTYIDGESDRHWTVKEENGYAYIISSKGMALSFKDGKLMLEKYSGDDGEKWIIKK